jgi:hypothetical protein
VLEYDLEPKIRAEMAQDEPAVKAALCKIANSSFATADQQPEGIFKFEGGVRVNNKNILIKGAFVRAASRLGIDETPTAEEIAVVDAIKQVASIIETNGIAAVREQYGECKKGDPLRDLMEGP